MKGFTLIELAVVLVIVGILLGGFIGTFSERIDTARYAETEKSLEDIRHVLMAYAFSKGGVVYLPCPDTDDPPNGGEDRDAITGACDATVGILPWLTLGIGHEDAWGAHYSYWVSGAYSVSGGFEITALDGDPLAVTNATIQTRVRNANPDVAQNAVAVVFSHGKNGLGAVGVDGSNRAAIPATDHDDENENVGADNIFMSHPPVKEGAAAVGGVFDDVMMWINSYELKAKMVETGVLP